MKRIIGTTLLAIFTLLFSQQNSVVVMRDGEQVGIIFPVDIEGYKYFSTDQLVTLTKGVRYFAPKKFKESIRMWGIRAVFSPENAFAIIDNVPYNLGLPVRLHKDGLMIPITGFFEAYSLATNSQLIFHSDTIKINSRDVIKSGDVEEHSPKQDTSESSVAKKRKDSSLGLIILDPGHGGKDPGAIGPSGIREKDITLSICKYLKSELEKRNFDVQLTRDSDVFIPLADRTKMANNAKADIFLSVHCNASNKPTSNGTQGFYLSPAKTDEARTTAALENKALLLEDDPIIDQLDELQFIMADMVQTTYQRESSILSYIIEQNVSKKLDIVARGPQGAGFYVLYGAFMPAALIEVAFISNKAEEQILSLPKNQQKIASAIAEGVEQFWENIKR